VVEVDPLLGENPFPGRSRIAQTGCRHWKVVIDANRSLVLEVRFIPSVEIVVRIRSAGRHRHVRHGNVGHQEGFEQRIDPVRGNDVAGKLLARVREIAGPVGLAGL